MSQPLKHGAFSALLIGALLLARALWLVFVPITSAAPSNTSIQALFNERLALAAIVLAVGLVTYVVQRRRQAAT